MSQESSRYTPEQEAALDKSREQMRAEASKRTGKMNQEEGRGEVIGLFNKNKKPLTEIDVMQADSLEENEKRDFAIDLKHYQDEAQKSTHNFWISLQDLRSLASGGKTTESRFMQDLRKNKERDEAKRAQFLLENLQPEIARVEEGLKENPPFYSDVVKKLKGKWDLFGDIRIMAQGGNAHLRRSYPAGWKSDDFARLLKDLQGDRSGGE